MWKLERVVRAGDVPPSDASDRIDLWQGPCEPGDVLRRQFEGAPVEINPYASDPTAELLSIIERLGGVTQAE